MQTQKDNTEQESNIIEYNRPAPVQVDVNKLVDMAARKPDMEGFSEFNIWFCKWTGKKLNPIRDPSPFRCKISRDSGLTVGSSDNSSSFCVFFAKGRCPYGKTCRFWHRLPTENDKEEMTRDCFGRDRYGEFKTDFGGIGAFERYNRTLQITRFALTEDNENMIKRHFEEWGPIEQIKVIPSENMAFVKYKRRIYAEFAKEAMSNQSLDRREVINVRWASKEDELEDRELQTKEAKELMYKAIHKTLPKEFVEASYNNAYAIEEETTTSTKNKKPKINNNDEDILSNKLVNIIKKSKNSQPDNQSSLSLLADYGTDSE